MARVTAHGLRPDLNGTLLNGFLVESLPSIVLLKSGLIREVGGWDSSVGQVGEWLKPTDCKSVPPCEVRRFESFPVHQRVLAVVAQLVERVLGKDEVTSSILVNGSRTFVCLVA